MLKTDKLRSMTMFVDDLDFFSYLFIANSFVAPMCGIFTPHS